MSDFKHREKEYNTRQNEYICPPGTIDGISVACPRHGVLTVEDEVRRIRWKHPVVVAALVGVLSVFITGLFSIAEAVLHVSPGQPEMMANDPCEGAEVAFSAANALTDDQYKLIAMRDHLARFGTCKFSSMANIIISDINKKLEGERMVAIVRGSSFDPQTASPGLW